MTQSPRPGAAVLFVLASAALLARCASNRAAPVSRADSREEPRVFLNRTFAESYSPKLLLDHEKFRKAGFPRDQRFYNLTMTINSIPQMPGINCMELLGTPDYWKSLPDGSAVLVYFYHGKDLGITETCIVPISADGKVSDIGYTRRQPSELDRAGFRKTETR